MPNKEPPPAILEAIEAEAERMYAYSRFYIVNAVHNRQREAHIAAMTRAYWMVSKAFDAGDAFANAERKAYLDGINRGQYLARRQLHATEKILFIVIPPIVAIIGVILILLSK